MLIIGNKYNITFPQGMTKMMTLKEIHQPKTIHQVLYTFLDSNNSKIMFTNGVLNRLKISEPFLIPPFDRLLIDEETYLPIGLTPSQDFLSDDDLYS